MSRIRGRVAVVTGASRGIGSAVARRLAAEGARVALVARSRTALEEIASELGASAIAVAADVTDRDGVRAMLERVESELGPVDILVNNAGIENYGHFDASAANELEQLVAVNLTAPLVLARLLVPGMVSRGFGHIVSMSSTAGLSGVPYGAAYAATKAALTALTFSLRMEYAGSGVSASTVAPGFVRGDGMYEQQLRETGGNESPAYLGSTTMDRVVDAVIAAIEGDVPEIIINSVPFRPAIGFGRMFPSVGLAVIRRLAGGYMKTLADARRRG